MIKDTVTFDDERIRIPREIYDAIYGDGSVHNPMIAFNDAAQQISTQQYSHTGRHRGYMHEWIGSEKEYFKRKLMGK